MPLKTSRKKAKPGLIPSLPTVTKERSILADIHDLSAGNALKRVMDHPHPRHLVRSLPEEDLFWLVKKIGEDDCIPILKLASEKQWQYLLDLELWDFDRLDLQQSFHWLRLLEKADQYRLAEWLLSEGQDLLYLFLFNNIRVEIGNEDDFIEPEDGVITLDGVFYIKFVKEERREVIERVLSILASENSAAYQTLLTGLAGVIPSEMEDEMYRLKNVRLAEHGFLGPEEAFEIYGRLTKTSLKMEGDGETVHPMVTDNRGALIPVSPLVHGVGRNLFTSVLSGISDPRLMDSLWLEFAGLCNQVISADRMRVDDLNDLVNTSQRTAGYLNLTLEETCGTNREKGIRLVENNSLHSLFRVGFTMTLELKWMAQRWIRESWFREKGLKNHFWGEVLGGILDGILEDKPKLYDPAEEEKFKFFERRKEILYVRKNLYVLKGLDTLLSNLAAPYSLNPSENGFFPETFQPIFLTIWARQLLGLDPVFAPLSSKQATELFRKLRTDESAIPYHMEAYKASFIKDFMAAAPNLTAEEIEALEEYIASLWDEFSEEYEMLSEEPLDPRFSRLILVEKRIIE